MPEEDMLTNALAKRKLASFIKRLPDERYLALVDTWEQLYHWMAHRGFYKAVSMYWKAMHNGEDDPIRHAVETGKMDWGIYNHVQFTVVFYERLWELLYMSFHDVSPEINRLQLFQPKTASMLFQWVAFDDANTDFAICLEPYCQISHNELAKIYSLVSKVTNEESVTSDEKKKIEKIADLNEAQLVMSVVLEICHKKATKKRPALKEALQAFYVALNNLNRHTVTLGKKQGCYAWIKGERVWATRGGSYSKNA